VSRLAIGVAGMVYLFLLWTAVLAVIEAIQVMVQ
jgi:hypothetical protein